MLLLFAIVSFKKFILLTSNIPEVLRGLFSSGTLLFSMELPCCCIDLLLRLSVNIGEQA